VLEDHVKLDDHKGMGRRRRRRRRRVGALTDAPVKDHGNRVVVQGFIDAVAPPEILAELTQSDEGSEGAM
jgi:hypothetical protein